MPPTTFYGNQKQPLIIGGMLYGCFNTPLEHTPFATLTNRLQKGFLSLAKGKSPGCAISGCVVIFLEMLILLMGSEILATSPEI